MNAFGVRRCIAALHVMCFVRDFALATRTATAVKETGKGFFDAANPVWNND
jgi:hypothetical protein